MGRELYEISLQAPYHISQQHMRSLPLFLRNWCIWPRNRRMRQMYLKTSSWNKFIYGKTADYSVYYSVEPSNSTHLPWSYRIMAIGVQPSHAEVAMRRRALAGKSGWVCSFPICFVWTTLKHLRLGWPCAQQTYFCYHRVCVSGWIVRIILFWENIS